MSSAPAATRSSVADRESATSKATRRRGATGRPTSTSSIIRFWAGFAISRVARPASRIATCASSGPAEGPLLAHAEDVAEKANGVVVVIGLDHEAHLEHAGRIGLHRSTIVSQGETTVEHRGGRCRGSGRAARSTATCRASSGRRRPGRRATARRAAAGRDRRRARAAVRVAPPSVARQEPVEAARTSASVPAPSSTTTTPAVACGTKTVSRPSIASTSARNCAQWSVRSTSAGARPVSRVISRVSIPSRGPARHGCP